MTRLVLAVAIGMAALATLRAAPQVGSDARAQELIRRLNLQLLDKESGYLGILGDSAQKVAVNGQSLAIQSHNYYMLTRALPIDYLHWLSSDDTDSLVEGGPVDYFVFHPDGRAEKITVGMDLAAGQRPIISVPGNCWKALRLPAGVNYALMADVLTPQFTPSGVKIGAGADWVKRYAGAAPWATPKALRELIGPNWTQ